MIGRILNFAKTFIFPLIDIGIVAYIVYRLYFFFVGKRAYQVLKGIILLILFAIIAKFMKLRVLSWIFDNFSTAIVISIVVLFQEEIRSFLTQFAQNRFLSGDVHQEIAAINELVRAFDLLARSKTGAIVCFEKNVGLKVFIEKGIKLNSEISTELILAIFKDKAPLHDGAVIIQKGRIAAACCYFPLSATDSVKNWMGARHRAALGISEITDALVVVVSEETGKISIVDNGNLERGVTRSNLNKILQNYMSNEGVYQRIDYQDKKNFNE